MSLLSMIQSPMAQLALLAQQQGQPAPRGPIQPQGPTRPMGMTPVPQAQFQPPDESMLTNSIPRSGLPKAQPSRVQQFGRGLLNAIAPQPGEAAQSLLGADAIRGAQRQALLSLSANLLQSGGASARPINIGEALGRGLQAAQQTYGGAINDGVTQAVNQASREALMEQRNAMAGNVRAQQAQREFDLQDRQRLAQLRPEYARIFSTLPATPTPEQRKNAYFQVLQAAQANGDQQTADEIRPLFAPGSTAFSDGAPAKYVEARQGDGTLTMVNPQNPKDYFVIGGAKPQDVGGGGSGGGSGTMPVQDRTAYAALEKKAALIADHGASYSSLQSALADPAIARNPTEQYNLLFQFVKSRDNSVVRASELALLNSANPADQQLGLWLKNKFTGQIVTLPMLKRMVDIMNREVQSQRAGLGADPRLGRLKRQGYELPEIDAIAAPASPAASAPSTVAPRKFIYKP